MTKSLPFKLGNNPRKAVFVPQPEAYGSPVPSMDKAGKLSSCTGCVYYKGEMDVTAAHPDIEGYGACNIMGLLVDASDGDHLKLPQTCPSAENKTSAYGSVSHGYVEVAPLRAPYNGTDVPEDAATAVTLRPPTIKMPPPRRAVTSLDASYGIVKWETVPAPKGAHKDADLPVFADCWTDIEQDMIPKAGEVHAPIELYEDHNDLLWLALTSHDDNMALNLLGDAGVGKTEFARFLAWKMQVPFKRINFSAQSEVGSIVGSPALKDGETVWKLGSFGQRLPKPGGSQRQVSDSGQYVKACDRR